MDQQKIKKLLDSLEYIRKYYKRMKKKHNKLSIQWSGTKDNTLRESMMSIIILKKMVSDTDSQFKEDKNILDQSVAKQTDFLKDYLFDVKNVGNPPTHIDILTVSAFGRSRSRNNIDEDPNNQIDMNQSLNIELDFSRPRKRSKNVDTLELVKDIKAVESKPYSFKLAVENQNDQNLPIDCMRMEDKEPDAVDSSRIIKQKDNSKFDPFTFSRGSKSLQVDEDTKWKSVGSFCLSTFEDISDSSTKLKRKISNIPAIVIEETTESNKGSNSRKGNNSGRNSPGVWSAMYDDLQTNFKKLDSFLNSRKDDMNQSINNYNICDNYTIVNKCEKPYMSDTEAENRRITRKRYQEKQESVGVHDFDFIAQLGKGAFGTVWLVKRKSTGDLYALKIIKFSNKDPTLIESLVNENQIMMSLVGDFAVKGIFSFIYKRYYCVVMELMVGGDFRKLLDENSAFYEEDAKFYAAELVLAVTHIHRQNITHRDLKPENMLLDNKGHLKLADFGLSNQLEDTQDIMDANIVIST